MKVKLNQEKLSIVFIFLMMINVPYLSFNTKFWLKVIMVIVSAIIIIHKSSVKSLIYENYIVILYAMWIIISTHKSIYNLSMYNAILYAAQSIIVYAVISNCFRKRDNNENYVLIYRISLVVFIITNMYILLTAGKGYVIKGENLPYYIIGNKFIVSYFNMFFLALYLGIKNRNIWKKIFILIVVCGSCLICECMTGVLGSIILFLLIFFKKSIDKIISNKTVMFIIIGCSSLLVPFFNAIMSSTVVQYTVTKLLNRNLTMTGRLNIYVVLEELIKNNPWFGYGYGNSIIYYTTGYANAQNGVFQIILWFGFIGLAIFCGLIYQSVRFSDKVLENKVYVMICFIYSMIFCSMVEPCLNYFLVILSLAVIRVYTSQYKTQKQN